MLEAIKMYFLPCLINVITVMYLILKISDVSLNKFFSKEKIVLLLIILVVSIFISIFNYVYVPKLIRFLVSTYIAIIMAYYLVRKKIGIIFIIAIIEQLILFGSELIFSIFVLVILQDKKILFDSLSGILFSNLSICLIAIFFVHNKFLLLMYQKIINYLNNVSKYNKYIIILSLVNSINIFLFLIYNFYNNILYIFINAFLILFYIIITFMLFIEKNKNIIYLEKNKLLLENLNEYEKMLDYQRVNNHENKNQLLVIKSMIEKKDNKLMEYISEIIKEKREDNEIIYNKAKRIPSGGLQGLIYQKMLLMQEKNIEVNLDINSQVRKINFGNLSSKMNYDICRIAGIIIDNAIEETTKFSKKNREIVISMYIDKEFIIEVSNRIKDDVDLSKIYEKGYTSKEKGHGYGLSLLKKIVDENEKIENEVKIINNIFTQIIKIKM